MQKQSLRILKIYQTSQSDIINHKEKIYFWEQVQIPNTICIKIPGIK
jgi:hypothetical protein